jgi:MFS transporter, DHA1 family, multidrug resistance protein
MASWKKSLIALWITQFLAMLGMSQVLPFLPLYIQSLGVKDVSRAASWSGVIFGAGFFMAGLLSPLWGVLADRWGPKRMVVRAMAGSALALGLMAFARNVFDLLLIRILHGGLGGFVSATTALTVALAPAGRMGFALGAIQTAFMAGVIAGPLLGGALVDAAGFRATILASGGLLVCGVLIVGVLVSEPVKIAPETRSPSLMENLRFVRGSRPLLAACAVQFISQMALMAVHPVMAIFLQQMDVSSERLGTVTGISFGITAAATLLSALFLGRQADRWGPVSIVRAGLLGAALVYFPQAFVSEVWMLLACRALLGICVGGIQPSVQSLIAQSAPAGRRAGVLGVTFAASIFGNAAGPVLGGVVSAWAGVRVAFFAAGLLLLAAWAVARASWKDGPAFVLPRPVVPPGPAAL